MNPERQCHNGGGRGGKDDLEGHRHIAFMVTAKDQGEDPRRHCRLDDKRLLQLQRHGEEPSQQEKPERADEIADEDPERHDVPPQSAAKDAPEIGHRRADEQEGERNGTETDEMDGVQGDLHRPTPEMLTEEGMV